MMLSRLQKCLRSSRQLHTIISQETIKPSSPTPLHLKTHNFSLIDQIAPTVTIRFIYFYQNYNHHDFNTLKKSLSQTLTTYYPFAGRLVAPSVPHIDCSDQGVEFLEVSNDSRLNEFDESMLDQFIPNYAVGNNSNLAEVWINHFKCGGVALGASVSHKVCDAYTVANFFNHWSTVTCGGSLENPAYFVPSKGNFNVPEFDFKAPDNVKYVTRTFVFKNSKLNELREKIKSDLVTNPTRVETLSSLIFKRAVNAATMSSGDSSRPSSMFHIINMRKKITGMNRPELIAGNVGSIAVAKMADSGDFKLNEVIAKLRKEFKEVKEVRDVEEVGKVFLNQLGTLGDGTRTYACTSVCRFPFYDVDFGWGKPARVIVRSGVSDANVVQMMDTPTGDGIEVMVQLEEKDMAIFQKDKEIVAYSQDMI